MTQNQNLKQRTRNALERLDALEQQFTNLITGLNNAFEQINRKTSTLEDGLEAVITILGVETVAQSITEIRLKRAEEAATQQREEVKALVEAGVYAKTEKITEKSVVVGREIDKDGKDVPPGYIKAPFHEIKPDLKEKFLGQVVGAKVETATNTTFEVQEIYEPVELTAEATTETGAPVAPTANPGEGTTTTVGPLV